MLAEAEKKMMLAEKLSVISWNVVLTGVVLMLAAHFDFPWIAAIGLQVICMAVVVGGILFYGKAKALKSANRHDKKAGIVSCMMVAFFLGPAVLNAAEVATWTRATADPEPTSSVLLAYGPVCAANDGGDGSGAMFGFAGPAHDLGAVSLSSVQWECVGAAIVALA